MTTTAPQTQPANQGEPFTNREIEVLYRLFDFEMDYSEIAQELGVTKAAVSFHVVNIFSKLSVDSRFAAVCMYARVSPAYRKAFILSLSATTTSTTTTNS
jgi:DNA-binding NarL/FixJ family response regulator